MKAVLITSALLLATFQAPNAAAQMTMTTSMGPPTPSAFGVDPILRITTTFRTFLPVSDPQPQPDGKAHEAARRSIYAMAAGECAVLSETFKAECRLASVSIMSPPMPSSSPPNFLSGTANYELKMAGATAGR